MFQFETDDRPLFQVGTAVRIISGEFGGMVGWIAVEPSCRGAWVEWRHTGSTTMMGLFHLGDLEVIDLTIPDFILTAAEGAGHDIQ